MAWKHNHSPEMSASVWLKCTRVVEQVFNYKSGRHNVMDIPKLDCSTLPQAKVLAATADPTPVRVPLTATGDTFYACSVSDHCVEDGQLVQVTTS